MEKQDWTEPKTPDRAYDSALYVNKPKESLDTTVIMFESGHRKEVQGTWKGDSVWIKFTKSSGELLYVNKDKVEYMETF